MGAWVFTETGIFQDIKNTQKVLNWRKAEVKIGQREGTRNLKEIKVFPSMETLVLFFRLPLLLFLILYHGLAGFETDGVGAHILSLWGAWWLQLPELHFPPHWNARTEMHPLQTLRKFSCGPSPSPCHQSRLTLCNVSGSNVVSHLVR